jgi:Protein of unknown function (DUF4054)
MTFTFDINAFFSQFPELSNNDSGVLSMYFDVAKNYVGDVDYGWLNGNSRQYALLLMTAHMATLSCRAATGSGGGLLISTSDEATSAAYMPPPAKSALSYWLNQSPYGQRLLALLSIKAAGGIYAAGSHATSNIRKFNGRF